MDLISLDHYTTVVLYAPAPWWELPVEAVTLWASFFYPLYLGLWFKSALLRRIR